MCRFQPRRGWYEALLWSATALGQPGPVGTVTGTVTDADTKHPVSDVGILVVGTNRAARTNAAGQYRSTNVPVGTQQIRAARLGYAALTQPATVTDGASARLALGDSSAASVKHQLGQLPSERAFWLYLTGHRLGDWRRMLRAPYNAAPYGFVTSDVYPVGGSLSATLEFPSPQLTSPNPNYKACDPTIP